jgi:hypothetical protein
MNILASGTVRHLNDPFLKDEYNSGIKQHNIHTECLILNNAQLFIKYYTKNLSNAKMITK